MQLSFEQEKNIKAGAYTLLICIALSCLFIVMHWQQPAPTVIPPATAYMEVNLGNTCLLYTSPSPRDRQKSRMPSSA